MGTVTCGCNSNYGQRYPTSYSIASVATGQLVDDAKFIEIANAVNSERVRRTYGTEAYAFTDTIDAGEMNQLVNGINTAGWTANFGGVASGQYIAASNINDMIYKLNQAAAVCICNCNYCVCDCNYCTCNCDYCTCNCNFGCTCNCNYSDIRLKENVEYVEMKNGLKLYSFNYIWDKVTKHVGVMAQDLLGTQYEKALQKDKNGYYMVDYSMLPI